MHGPEGTFPFDITGPEGFAFNQNITDARADLICLLVAGGGGGLAMGYTKQNRQGRARPDQVSVTDVNGTDHPNVVANRDGAFFSVISWNGAISGYIFAAEIAHNLGAGHAIGDRNADVGVPVNPMDYGVGFESRGQDNPTFSPYRNNRLDPNFGGSGPLYPTGAAKPPGVPDNAPVLDSYLALGVTFKGQYAGGARIYSTIGVYGTALGRTQTVIGLFSTPKIYYQGTNIGEQYGWRMPPPQGDYTVPIKFDDARTMTTVGRVVSFYRDHHGAARKHPERMVAPLPPRGTLSSYTVQNTSPKQNRHNPISYAPGVVPVPGAFIPSNVMKMAAAPAAQTGGNGLSAVTSPSKPNQNPGGLPAVVTPVPPNPKPGGGLGGTINPAPPPVTTTPGLRNDNYRSVYPLPGNPITALGAVFPARALAILDSTNRGATREEDYDSPLAGRRTVWFRWNAPAQLQGKGLVNFSTKGSDFDTMIKVMWDDPAGGKGAGYDLQDNAKTGPWSEGKYPWKPRQVFLICVDGVGGAQGTIRISAQIE
jgi:hypothetical protein